MTDWNARTVGLEIELPTSHTSVLEGLSEFLSFTPHDDGSLRKHSYILSEGLCVLPMEGQFGDVICAGMEQQRAYGLEIVTRAYPFSEIRPKLKVLGRHYRHVPKDNVCSIHFHVDIGNMSWRHVQNVLRWVYYLEAVLFRIAAAGKEHRGVFNDYQFCRPLSNPIGALWGRTKGASIQLMDLLNADTSSQMVYSWGRADRYCEEGSWNVPHYIGQRYHMVNIMSCFRIGTFEWRLFDPIYEHLEVFADVAIAVHRLAEGGRPDFEPMLLGDKPAISCDQASELLNVDLTSVWGDYWQPACRNTHPDPHTSPLAFSRSDPVTIRYDEGTDDDVLYVRV